MEHLETVIDYVSAWEERDAQASAVLRLQNGLALSVARDDPRYERLRSDAQLERQAPVYVQFDPQTKSVRLLLTSVSRQVESVEIAPDGRATVTFFMSPSFYFVRPDQPTAAAMIALLQRAARDHQPILVIFHPSTLEILDVRPAGQ